MSDRLFPVQGGNKYGRHQGVVPECVHRRAYEVYSVVYAPQASLLEGDCRGGFGKNELVAFLYASGFPQNEWRQRVDEACRGMEI